MPGLTSELLAVYHGIRVSGLDQRRFGPETYWDILRPILDAGTGLSRERVGESAERRPLRMVSFGEGEVAVLAWSQMHGDESTASMALADICSFLGRSPDHPLAQSLRRRLSLRFIPMLNPDGAARFQRHNAAGIDINRDARRLATSEGRTLKAVRDRVRPDFGFNLHDQSTRFRVGASDRMAAIALLAPAYNEAREVNRRRRAAMRVCGVVRRAVERMVDGNVTRYDDTFNPRAFGDLMGAWGASTILIESGGWRGDPEKQYLRRVNFVAILCALASIADGSHAGVDLALYDGLPPNGRLVSDLLLAGGTLIAPGLPPVVAGEGHRAPDGSARIRPGGPADLVVARDPAGREVVRSIRPKP